MPKKVNIILVESCSFFRQFYGKSLNPVMLENLQEKILLALCPMEMLFPSSFFTTMVYLTIYLVKEAKSGGHVHY